MPIEREFHPLGKFLFILGRGPCPPLILIVTYANVQMGRGFFGGRLCGELIIFGSGHRSKVVVRVSFVLRHFGVRFFVVRQLGSMIGSHARLVTFLRPQVQVVPSAAGFAGG